MSDGYNIIEKNGGFKYAETYVILSEKLPVLQKSARILRYANQRKAGIRKYTS